VILKECGNREFKKILVPIAGGPNSLFALEIASILAEKDDSKITAFIVNEKNGNFDISAAKEPGDNHFKINWERITIKGLSASNIGDAILDESEKHDLVILGSTMDPILKQVTRESVSHSVAKNCQKPMIIVKASGGIKSWIRRWL
ncbi:MAG: universal stress protein, partial [Candidatus Aminicenantes bacterium]|nr:universal stress protein [Candidatus Aminicenantes bacterium]